MNPRERALQIVPDNRIRQPFALRGAIIQAINAAVLAERERCAQVCETVVYENSTDLHGRSEVKLAAKLIRLDPEPEEGAAVYNTPEEIAQQVKAVRAEFAELQAARALRDALDDDARWMDFHTRLQNYDEGYDESLHALFPELGRYDQARAESEG